MAAPVKWGNYDLTEQAKYKKRKNCILEYQIVMGIKKRNFNLLRLC